MLMVLCPSYGLYQHSRRHLDVFSRDCFSCLTPFFSQSRQQQHGLPSFSSSGTFAPMLLSTKSS